MNEHKILHNWRRTISTNRANADRLDIAWWYLARLQDMTPSRVATHAIILCAEDYGLDDALAAVALVRFMEWAAQSPEEQENE